MGISFDTQPINRYRRFAKIALDLAVAMDQDVTHQLCALVVNKNRVLSVGYNSPKTHTISKDTTMQQLHAEMEAIIRCPEKDLEGADVVVVRAKGYNRPGLAKPCEVCEKILRRFGIKRVFYTVNSEDPNNPEVQLMRL